MIVMAVRQTEEDYLLAAGTVKSGNVQSGEMFRIVLTAMILHVKNF